MTVFISLLIIYVSVSVTIDLLLRPCELSGSDRFNVRNMMQNATINSSTSALSIETQVGAPTLFSLGV